MSNGDEPVHLVVDRDVCIGIGQCEMLEPDVFEYHDADGFATVRDGATLQPARADAVVKACPSGAIKPVAGGA